MPTLDEFLEFEKEHRLFELQYAGVNFWHLIRFELIQSIVLGLTPQNMHPDSATGSIFQKISFIRHIPKQVLSLFDRKHYTIFVSSAYRPKIIEGVEVNPYTYFLSKFFTWNTKKSLLFSAKWPKNIPSQLNNSLTQFLYLFPFLFIRIFPKSNNKQLMVLYEMLLKKYNLSLSKMDFLNRIRKSVAHYQILRVYYKYILQKGHYQVVFISCHYDIFQFSLISAARELNIPSIEHQHGTMSGEHGAYNFKDLSSIGKLTPDYIFTFGEFWNSVCRLPNCTKKIAVGSPLAECSLKNCSTVVQSKKIITFYSQGTIGKELSKLACDFADIMIHDGFEIIYKLHPSECQSWRKIYPCLAENKNIQVIDQAVDVNSCLARSKYCVGVYSTVLYEALCFHCKVFIYHLSLASNVQDTVARGLFSFFENVEQLRNFIIIASKEQTSYSTEDYWKSNSLNNIEREINSIIRLKQKKQGERNG